MLIFYQYNKGQKQNKGIVLIFECNREYEGYKKL